MDIEHLCKAVPQLATAFNILDKIGEGMWFDNRSFMLEGQPCFERASLSRCVRQGRSARCTWARHGCGTAGRSCLR